MRKLSISRAWDETRIVLASDGKLIGTVALALIVLPGLVLNLLPGMRPANMGHPNPWLVVGVIPVVVSLVGQLSVMRLAMEPHVSVGEAIAHGTRRLLPYLGAVLIWTVPILLVGSLLLGLVGKDPAHPPAAASMALILLTAVGVFISVRLVLMSAIATAETAGPIAMLERSWELTRGNWWRLFGFLLLCLIAAMALLFAAEAVTALIARLLFGDVAPLSVGWLLVLIAGQLANSLILVVLFVMLARIYVQLSGAGHADVSVPSSGS